jgi:hypothetical protein
MALSDFKINFVGGTRQNRFLVSGTFPDLAQTNTTSTTSTTTILPSYFHIRSTLIPTLQTSTISYDYFGRKHHYPGEKLYSTWSVSVLDDNPIAVSASGNLWNKFHSWHNAINNHDDYTTQYPTQLDNYKADWTIQHLNLNGIALKTFKLGGLWPRTINEISFNHSRPNVLNTFNVVFVYDTIEIVGVTDQGLTPTI